MSNTKEKFNEDFRRLLDMTRESLYYVISAIETREQAIAVKEQFARPLGILNSKHNLASNARHRRRPAELKEQNNEGDQE